MGCAVVGRTGLAVTELRNVLGWWYCRGVPVQLGCVISMTCFPYALSDPVAFGTVHSPLHMLSYVGARSADHVTSSRIERGRRADASLGGGAGEGRLE